MFSVFQGNITTCGVVGAYALILAVNAYIYTSLSYITLNILKRFLNNNFSAVFTDVPFQTIGEFTTEIKTKILYPVMPTNSLLSPFDQTT